MVMGGSPNGPRLTQEGRCRLRGLAAVAMAALCLVGGNARAQDATRHAHDRRYPHQSGYPIKASHLAKFPAFVAWPEAAFETPLSPFRLCVAGQDPFGPILDRFTNGARVGDHAMTVSRLPLVAKGADCHVLFISTARGQTAREMLAAVAGRPVLTVADEGLDAPGAMIQFVTVEGRVRFEIQADVAQAEGLVVSSKLLSLSAARGTVPR